MNIVLWILQILLAAIFLWHGWLLLAPPPELVENMNAFLPTWFRLFLGTAEVLAAGGLILPGVLRIMPWLISLTSAGLMIVMISATGVHIVRNETSSAIITAVIFLLVTLVGYMRWKVYPIPPKGGSSEA